MDDDGDDKDDTKRKSRNLSEKKRRDQFNLLINELSSMVSSSSRKMDKSTVLKSTISFLRNHNEVSTRSRTHEIQEDWKPSFLSNEEFTHIILESVDGFIIVFSLSGQIIYASGSITSLLGYLPSDVMNGRMTIFDLVCEEDHCVLYDIFSSCRNGNSGKENHLQFSVYVKRAVVDPDAEPVYDFVHFVGYFRGDVDATEGDSAVSSTNVHGDNDAGMVFVGTGRLGTAHVISEMTFTNDTIKSEFTSRHNLDWKFLALDSRATPIIGYVQLEVVGTSGYDYYHVDDLDKIVSCHEALMEKGEGTSCYYRFLTKGQQWIWLQTRYYISYHQWNSKPEFVVCNHRVINYVDVLIQSRKLKDDSDEVRDDVSDPCQYDPRSPRRYRGDGAVSSCRKTSGSDVARHSGSRSYQDHTGSDSLSEDSYVSKSSHFTNISVRSVRSLPLPRRHHHHQQQQPVKTCPLSPAQATSTYVEPRQYVTAIPLQPIITSYPVAALPPQEMIRQSPSPLTDQVKRKQLELNQLRQLMCQKEEELQQFVMAQSRYRLVPSLLNVTLPYTVPSTAVSSTTQQAVSLNPTATSPTMSTSRGYSRDPQQGGMTVQLPDSEMIPFQFPDHQAQLLFQSNLPPQDHPPNCH